jgi:hypothetical protein
MFASLSYPQVHLELCSEYSEATELKLKEWNPVVSRHTFKKNLKGENGGFVLNEDQVRQHIKSLLIWKPSRLSSRQMSDGTLTRQTLTSPTS